MLGRASRGFLPHKHFLHLMHMYSSSVDSRHVLRQCDRHIFTMECVIVKFVTWNRATALWKSMQWQTMQIYSGFSCNAFKNWAPLLAIGLCEYIGTDGLMLFVFNRHIFTNIAYEQL